MRKWGALAIGGVLLISFATPVNAAAPKAGATCTKKNATATSAGKLYTCILSGKKLVWNKGVAIPKPNATPTQTTQIKNSLASDSRITSISALSAISICKTTDITPEYRQDGINFYRNGFPRPKMSSAGIKQAKILVIPMSFKNLEFGTEKIQRGQIFNSDYDALKEVIPQVQSAFSSLSNKRFTLKIDVLPQSEWWKFEVDQPFTDVWGVPNTPRLLDLIKKYKSNFKFDGYDSYAFVAGNGPRDMRGLGSAQAMFADPLTNSTSGFISGLLMVGGFSDPTIWVHELGHSLFAFEDLYLFGSGNDTAKSKEFSVPLKWDLMADATKLQLLQWNRLLMGWISDSEVRCLTDQKSTIHYLGESDSSSDPKLLTINLVPGVTLAAEPRNNGNEKGLLLYTINTYISHGEGPVLTQNTLVAKGQTKSWLGWDFTVLDANSQGILFSATKTDVNKFVPPAQVPGPPPSSQQQTSKIVVGRGDILPNGYLKGRATWEVTGHQSYRLYVTAVDDFQKVYFETGYVNDSRNPLVIDISGLVCNKELRTVTEFFSEKDGKGERMVIESKQLSNLSCDSSSKQP